LTFPDERGQACEMKDSESGKSAGRRAHSNPVLGLVRTLCLALVTPWDLLICLIRGAGKDADRALSQSLRSTRVWAGHCLRLLGLRVRVEGHVPEGPVLFCPNHAGYVDIIALASVCETFFIAQDDLESWPILGPMYRSCRHMSISRRQQRAVLKATERIAARLRNGYSTCVFLEGTSSGNDRVLPFHASLVQAAINAEVAVVPVGIRWRSRDGNLDVKEDLAYWKDHVFGSHLFRLAGLSGAEATIAFGSPIECGTRSRKELADSLRAEVARLAGLPTAPGPSGSDHHQ
jgi:1-acyl-sn-glycerol-3-phosphate acyltransferase